MLGRHKRAAEVEPEGPLCPPELAYLWGWFNEVSMGVAANGFAPSMITWEALRAWKQETGNETEPWESRLLIRLSHCRAGIEAEKTTKPTTGSN